MKPPLVSVLMPIYNGERYLASAIDSVLGQSYQHWELILVNDGSHDNSGVIVQQFSSRHPQIRYVEQPNRGLPAALNAGLRQATGACVAVLAQDDQWLPCFLQTLVNVLEKNPRAAAAYGLARMMDANGHDLPQTFGHVFASSQLYDHLIEGNFIPACAVMIRRTVLDSVGGYDETLYFEDWDLWLRLAAVYPILSVPDILLRYRIHENNMTKQLSKMEQGKFAVVRKHFGEENDDVAECSVDKRRAYAGVYYRFAINYISVDDWAKGISYLKKSFMLWTPLCKRRDPYYEIACAYQSIGERGNLSTLDLDRATSAVETALANLFADLPATHPLAHQRRIIYGLAYQVLGELAFGRGAQSAAKQFLLRAVQQDIFRLTDIKYLRTMLRALALPQLHIKTHHANSLS